MNRPIKKKIDKLEKYTDYLSLSATYIQEDFMSNPLIYGGTERYIILGLKCIEEICMEIKEAYYFQTTNNQTKLLQILADQRVYPKELSNSLSEYMMYIQELQEDYLECMSKNEIYEGLDPIIRDFRYFKKYVLEYIF